MKRWNKFLFQLIRTFDLHSEFLGLPIISRRKMLESTVPQAPYENTKASLSYSLLLGKPTNWMQKTALRVPA
jgi:hypothetical protein